MRSRILKGVILLGMLLGLPLLGVLAAGKPLARYLEFPPKTRYVVHTPFSWIAFFIFTLFILLAVIPFLMQSFKKHLYRKVTAPNKYPFPWWGWLGLCWGVCAWIAAWSRFSILAPLQMHTFTPLWWGYILVINALTYRRTGSCMMLRTPLFFGLLFPLSAVFWWFFEFLNRFVQNWYYVGSAFSPWAYFWYATLPFSTVLPAVIGTREWLLTFDWPHDRFRSFLPLKTPRPKLTAWGVLVLSGAALGGIGIWPDYLFPFLWVAPLLILVALAGIRGEAHVFTPVGRGDWHLLVASALAALICGFFWEMWNFFSLAKWEYAIPFVHRFQLFEMPVLGYAGYLPFGIECAVVSNMLGTRPAPGLD